MSKEVNSSKFYSTVDRREDGKKGIPILYLKR